MRLLKLSSSILGLSLIAAGCNTITGGPQITQAQLLKNVKQAVDPVNKLKQAKTKVVVCKVQHGKEKPAKLFIKVKAPNKFKRMLVIPGKGVRIEAYNGKTGWTFSTAGGIKRVTGKALDELKLQTALAVNRGNLKLVFKKVKFVGTADIAGKNCYKIIGYPKDIYKSQPLKLYIDKKTFLPVAKEEIFDTATGPVPVVTIWGDYEKKGGVNIPMSRVVDINGNLLDISVLSVIWNCYVDDSEFEPPVKLK